MANIRVLNDISIYNSITAVSGISSNTLTISNSGAVGSLSINSQPLNGYKLAVSGDAYISGNLTVTGSASFRNTEYTTTSSISVTNNGTGPALVVNQTGDEAIAAFYDDNNIALYVDGHTSRAGNIGVGTITPNAKLTVVGDISASGVIYGSSTINKFVSAFGDGFNTSYVITHNLGVQDVVVTIVDTANQEVVYPLVTNTAFNQILVQFTQAPALTAYKAIIIG